MTGAEQLSEAILESDTEVVRAQHDLHAQMTTRKERLSFLIKFINDNSALTKVCVFTCTSIILLRLPMQMSQRSRQTLATDAEKLYAAHQLWLRHNESLQFVQTLLCGLSLYSMMQTVLVRNNVLFRRLSIIT